MIVYLDASVLVATITREAKTLAVQTWLGAQDPDELAISDWGIIEVSSALSIKVRTGQIDLAARARVLAAFGRLCADNLATLPVSGLHFRLASQYADRHELGLRAGDALHLAVCADYGATLITLDRRFGEAAIVIGVPATLL